MVQHAMKAGTWGYVPTLTLIISTTLRSSKFHVLPFENVMLAFRLALCRKTRPWRLTGEMIDETYLSHLALPNASISRKLTSQHQIPRFLSRHILDALPTSSSRWPCGIIRRILPHLEMSDICLFERAIRTSSTEQRLNDLLTGLRGLWVHVEGEEAW